MAVDNGTTVGTAVAAGTGVQIGVAVALRAMRVGVAVGRRLWTTVGKTDGTEVGKRRIAVATGSAVAVGLVTGEETGGFDVAVGSLAAGLVTVAGSLVAMLRLDVLNPF